MANYTPTRMVLNQLKGRLTTARRGHKLLKDKRDELMRQFMDIVKQNKELRKKVEEGLTEAFASLSAASAVMSPQMLEQALLYPRRTVDLDLTYKNVMSVNVPQYSFATSGGGEDIVPYAFAQTSGDLVQLAEVEKTMQLMAEEIESTRRRVNALEYSTIPDLETNIHYITMKLEENENSTKVRLIKVKEMVLQKAHNYSV